MTDSATPTRTGLRMLPSQHRTRVGAERREKTRLRLIESALEVYAAKGVEATVIDDVIVAAGVSRGTVYNYFRTDAELLAAVSESVSTETVRRIESAVGALPDPAERMAQGLRLCLHLARSYPLFARFFSMTGFNAIGPGHLMFEYVPRHITEAVALKRMDVSDVTLAVDMMSGAVLGAVHAIATRLVSRAYPEKMVLHMLLGLGMSRANAQKLVDAPLVELPLPPDSLLVRTQPAPQTAKRRAPARRPH